MFSRGYMGDIQGYTGICRGYIGVIFRGYIGDRVRGYDIRLFKVNPSFFSLACARGLLCSGFFVGIMV